MLLGQYKVRIICLTVYLYRYLWIKIKDNVCSLFCIKALIISHNGASGDFPGATDLAFQKAIDDGADIIDCSVQMSKDGVAFCSDRADIIKTTTAATLYIDQTRNIPEIQPADGVFSFDLTWDEIQALRRKHHNLTFPFFIFVQSLVLNHISLHSSTNREHL